MKLTTIHHLWAFNGVGGVNTKIMRNGLSNDSKLCTDIVLTLIEPSKYSVSSKQFFLVTYNPLKYITKNAINQEALYMNANKSYM